ncbi:Ig domain-containing protein [Pelagicoccus sp. SDUM812003]|uniref:Ig domain-containing protein n=1 Tax=Pelagicoccus sp. SDUM812003 TaxID=3041267 RepID=UPI00280ED2E5|nr:Ig domain-containing protein [Pelagicoccus sp. SDUM812003]MDQ8202029.1 Ig domain-containing protein [Pelagicoccus sp. SDUM812003]
MHSLNESFSRALVRGFLTVAAALGLTLHSHAAPSPIDDGEVGAAYSYDLKANLNWGGGDPPDDLTYTEGAKPLPDGLSINQSSGVISGVPTTAGSYISTITLTYEGEANNVEVSLTISPQSGTPEITSASLSVGMVGEAYTYTITASENPTTFNVDPDELPPGLSADASTGAITGTPSEPGSYPLTISANNAIGTGADFTLTITIDPAGDLPEITSSATLTGDVDEQISYQIAASNNATEYEAENLPFGVTMDDSSTGFISGTPSVEGTYEVSIRARNEFGWSPVFTLTITIGAVPQISSSLTLSLQQGTEMDEYLITASNSPTTFSVGTLPSGLSYSSGTRKITGTPTVSGTFEVSIYAINGVGQGPTSTLTISISPLSDYSPLRPAEFSVTESDGMLEFYLAFEQSAEELANYNYFIETSADLQEWQSMALDSMDNVVIEENEDGSTSVSVQYSAPAENGAAQFIRYRVEEKS